MRSLSNFEIIGEAVKNINEDLKKQFPATDWKAVAGFRDTLDPWIFRYRPGDPLGQSLSIRSHHCRMK